MGQRSVSAWIRGKGERTGEAKHEAVVIRTTGWEWWAARRCAESSTLSELSGDGCGGHFVNLPTPKHYQCFSGRGARKTYQNKHQVSRDTRGESTRRHPTRPHNRRSASQCCSTWSGAKALEIKS